MYIVSLYHFLKSYFILECLFFQECVENEPGIFYMLLPDIYKQVYFSIEYRMIMHIMKMWMWWIPIAVIRQAMVAS